MLIVVVIVIILVALSAGAYFYWIGAQQRSNSEGTIRTVNTMLGKHWTYVVEEAKKESPSAAVLSLAGGDQPRAQVLWIKARLVEAFPISYAEINSCPMYASIPGIGAPAIPSAMRKYNRTYQKTLGTTVSNNAATESAASLLIALSASRGGNRLVPDTLGAAVVDTDNDGIPELVDGWRTALGFYRFAWNNPVLQAPPVFPFPAGSKQARFADPQDPAGTLLNSTWYASGNRSAAETYFGFTISSNAGSTSNYVLPVIVSAGPDSAGVVPPLFGIGLNTSGTPAATSYNDLNVSNASQAADDIFSFNLN
jgi:hypothetical protein